MAALLLLVGSQAPGRAAPLLADIRFDNCRPAAGGGITCDTQPEGNTLLNDEAARYGLFDDASPGWSEFEPYQADDQMFGN
ncbi:MAG: hypothetical protein HQ527_05320 [Cyanobacteria bacterium]|nr:hypothetical protein [Cyanobacteria bacterium bin.51]